MNPHIRPATADDLPAINRIYNYYVLNSVTTYQLKPSTAEERADWFAAHDAAHPVIVAVSDGKIVGWGSLSRFHARAAFGHTVEDAVYVDHEHLRNFLGTRLLHDLCERAKTLGHHTIIAGIDSEQEGSVALHAKFGFSRVAHLHEVGFKFGRWLDVFYMQKMI